MDMCKEQESTLAIVNTPEKLVRAWEKYKNAAHLTPVLVGLEVGQFDWLSWGEVGDEELAVWELKLLVLNLELG